MIVIGIDPGLQITGYACMAASDGRLTTDPTLLEAGVIRLRATRSVAERLVELERDLLDILERHAPTHGFIERLFAHYRHPTTAITMGHARGVCLLALRRAGVQIGELGATEVKKSLTGGGHASKRQMQLSVQAQLGLADLPNPPDVADAIAIALTGARRMASSAMIRV